jgi:hypothetical protein
MPLVGSPFSRPRGGLRFPSVRPGGRGPSRRGRLGSGRLGSGRLGSGRLGSGRLGFGWCAIPRDEVLHGVVLDPGRGEVHARVLAIEELAQAAQQVRPAQPQAARDQLGDDRAEGGRGAEDEGQPDGQVKDP